MARPAQAEAQQASQEATAALILPLLARAWDLLDFDRLDVTVPLFRDATQAVVAHFGRASAAIAAQHFKAARLGAGVPGRINIAPTHGTPEGFVDQLVAESIAEAMERLDREFSDRFAAGAEQMVLDHGRRQMLSAVALDREAKGWARVPNEGACSFCLMLALRATNGLLYTSKLAAGTNRRSRRNANRPDERFTGAGGFKVHDNCRCTVEPVFGRYEATALVREAQATWDEATKGRTGHDARAAFRQAVEGREVTGSETTDTRKRGRRSQRYADSSAVTPENQRRQLRVLEAMPPAKTPAAAEWRVKRVAEIRKYLSKN